MKPDLLCFHDDMNDVCSYPNMQENVFIVQLNWFGRSNFVSTARCEYTATNGVYMFLRIVVLWV